MTVTRVVTWIPTIPVTVGPLKTSDVKNGDSYKNGVFKASKNEDSCEGCDLDTRHPCDCGHF